MVEGGSKKLKKRRAETNMGETLRKMQNLPCDFVRSKRGKGRKRRGDRRGSQWARI